MVNKKADLPVVVLVIGVIFICGLALLSFSISHGNSIDYYDLVENVKMLEKEYKFYESVGKDPKLLMPIFITPNTAFPIPDDNFVFESGSNTYGPFINGTYFENNKMLLKVIYYIS